MNKNKKYVLQKCIAGILSLTGLVACFTSCNKNEQKENVQTEITQTASTELETKKEETTTPEVQSKLIDDEKYKTVKQDIKAIQKELHIPDKYLEIPEVLDSIMQILTQNENYMIGFTATNLDEKLAKFSSNKIRYSVDGNFSYNETEDELVIFNEIDGQKHRKRFEYLIDDSQCFISDSIAFDKNGNPINNVIITTIGFDFNNYNEDYIEYNTGKNYISYVYKNGNTTSYLFVTDYDINITIQEISNKVHKNIEYSIKPSDDYKEKITNYFNERNHAEMKKILDELIKNNSVSICEIQEIATYKEGVPNHVRLSLDNNKLLASLYELETFRTYDSTDETWNLNYADSYDFEYTITDEEEQELSNYILNGDCESSVNYTKVLDKKYKK